MLEAPTTKTALLGHIGRKRVQFALTGASGALRPETIRSYEASQLRPNVRPAIGSGAPRAFFSLQHSELVGAAEALLHEDGVAGRS